MKTFSILAIAAATTLAVTPVMAEGKGRHGGGERASFEQLDANNDGAVTLAELQAQSAARFAEADTNGDGGLSAEEMLAQRNKGNENRAERRVKRMISRMDANNNGMLEIAEMQKRFDGERIMKHLDADSDGKITAAEFEAGKGRHGGRRGDKNGSDDT